MSSLEATLFFQLVSSRYERGSIILTSNKSFAEWGEVFGDPVIATASLTTCCTTVMSSTSATTVIASKKSAGQGCTLLHSRS